jgi:hypothetical protein
MAAPTFNAAAPVGTFRAFGLEGAVAADAPTTALPTDQFAQLRAVQGFVAITVSDSTVLTPGQGLGIICTVPGNVTINAPDNSSYTFPVNIGLNIFPFGIKKLMSTGTTATATYAIYL